MLPPRMSVGSPAFMCRLLSAVLAPTAAEKVVVPVPVFTVSASAPLTVLSKLTAALFVATAIAPVARVTGPLKVIAAVAGPLLLPTAPLTVMPPAAVKLIGPATARPALGKLSVCAVTLSAVRFDVKPISARPVTVPAPPASAFSVRFSAPVTGPPKLKVLPLETTLTGPPTSVKPPFKAMPSKPLMVLPALPPVVTRPVNVEPVLPLVKVTLPSKVTGPVALMPERACTVPSNVVAPEPCSTSAAPVPEPSGATFPTAPPKVVVPVPEFTVRFSAPLMAPKVMPTPVAVRLPPKVMAPL